MGVGGIIARAFLHRTSLTISKMNLNLKHTTYYPWLFAGGCIVLLPLVFLLLPDSRFQAAITAIGCLGGVVHFLYSQHHQDARFFRELFTDFNKRFDKLTNDLNTVRMRTPTGTALKDEQKRKLSEYFDLCAEEHLFHEAGYIDQRVWEAWCRGMVIFDNDLEIRKYWENELGTGSYYGFSLDEIRRLADSHITPNERRTTK